MKRAGSRRKKLLAVVGIAAALLAAVVAALPWWFPWVLSPVLKQYGIRFTGYQAYGWTGFELRSIRAEYDDVVVETDRVEGPSPFAWLLSQLRRDDSTALTVSSAGWRVRILPSGAVPRGKPAATPSTAAVMDELSDVLAVLRQWLPAARLTNGVVEIVSDKIDVPSVVWTAGSVAATARSPRFTGGHLVELHGDFTNATSWTISGKAGSADLEARLDLMRTNDTWRVEGGGQWRSNRIDLASRFEAVGWWPKEARVVAPSIRLPADVLAWDGYEDITGNAMLQWTGAGFTIDVTAAGKPSPKAPKGLPPVELTMRASGDLDAVFVEALRLTGPGLQAELSERVGVTREGRMLTDGAALNLSLDLARLPWTSMTGTLQGSVRLRPGGTNQPKAAFQLTGTGLTHAKLALKKAALAGEFNGPLLDLRRAEATLDDGSIFSASARIDFKTQSANDGRWEFRGRLPGFLMPLDVDYTNLRTAGEFSGPIARPRHSGRLTAARVTLALLDPFDLSFEWQGEALELSRVNARLEANQSQLTLGGAARLGAGGSSSNHVTLRELAFERNGEALYALKRPCEMTFLADSRRPGEWSAKLTPLEWAGNGRDVLLAGEAEWPRQGTVRGTWNGVSLEDFADFVRRPMPASCVISNLNLNASWKEGPITFELAASARLATQDGTPFAAQASLRGNASGLELKRAIISGTVGNVVSIEGALPLVLMPGSTTNWLRWDEKDSIDLRAVTASNERFWDGVAAMTGARFSKPELNLSVRGTLARPLGVLRARAERLAWEPSTNGVTPPTVENLDVEAEFLRDRAQLKALTVELEGQPVRAHGELPLGKTFWPDLVSSGRLPDWREARGEFEIVDARLELFTRYLPDILSPEGRLSLEVALQPGAKLDGLLEITNAATRPLNPIGRVHDIEARVRFHDQTATIEMFRGELGGQPVRVTGSASLVDKHGLQFETALRGTNVPLVREAGVLVRSDLNLRLVQKLGQPTLVSGEAILRNGLFLQDLKSLVPTGPSRQSRRPPYFNVEEPPFADWQLDVRINGDRSLRVRTPLFRGDISTALQLSGTMKEPVALGEVSIFAGRMQFPFGTLQVDRGYVSLTSENPYRPNLFVTASGYTYGYAIKMEVTGPADEPRMTFTSAPPLTSEQIVLMLTAGELPREEFVLTDQQRVARLGMFLGRDFLGRILGIDGGAERLTIRSGEYMTDKGEQTYYLEYRLTDDWSVVGEYDRFNALNAGLKWRIFSK
jgi:translocation and assembly module TamB